MKRLTTVVIALALCLIAVSSALGQAIVCTERRVDGTTNNWYLSEGRMVTVNSVPRLAYDPGVVHEPNGSYPIVYFYLSIGGSPTSDSFAGTGEFTFPPQADGVEIQVHYQKAGDDWDVGQTTKSAGAQTVRCLNMVVPKGFLISFVVRVKVEDWVSDGTPINVELKGLTGLFGVTLGEIPEFQLSPNTGPWRMTWWKHPVLTNIEKSGSNLRLTVASPPHYWDGNWYLETSTDLRGVWTRVTPTPILMATTDPIAISRVLQVPFNGAEPCRFFRTVLAP